MPDARSPRLAAVASLGVLVFAAWQGVATLGNTPAFNQQLRVEAPYGGSRPILTATMYDTAAYLYQIGFGEAFFIANLLIRGADATAFSLEAIQQHTARGADLAARSLELNPANAHAWMLLAETLRGKPGNDAAVLAYRRSGETAPYSLSLARRRLRFATGLAEDLFTDPGIEAIIARDARVLASFGGGLPDFVIDAFPDLAAGMEAQTADRQ